MTNSDNTRIERAASHNLDAKRAVLIDVLRGIAVLAVLSVHNGMQHLSRAGEWPGNFLWILSHGYLGVQLFFVISGYCIQGAVDSAARSAYPLRQFTSRRLRRIYPPYWCSLLFIVALALGTMLATRNSWSTLFPLSLRDWVLNVLLLQGPFGAPDAAMVYWSLTIEVQFYVLMGIGLLWRQWSPVWYISLSVLYLLWVISPSVGIAGTVFAYWPEFACGIAAYLALHHGRQGRWTALSLLLLTVASLLMGIFQATPVLTTDGELSTPYKQLFCLCCGCVLWLALSLPGRYLPLALLRPLAVVGTISYSLYLTHVPIGVRVQNLAGRLINLEHGGQLPVTALVWLIQFFGGYLFYRYCEKPWLNPRPTPPASLTQDATNEMVAYSQRVPPQ